jgi:hypothetical protein
MRLPFESATQYLAGQEERLYRRRGICSVVKSVLVLCMETGFSVGERSLPTYHDPIPSEILHGNFCWSRHCSFGKFVRSGLYSIEISSCRVQQPSQVEQGAGDQLIAG